MVIQMNLMMKTMTVIGDLKIKIWKTMSKIAEKKALEAYPVKELKDNFGTRDINRCMREACIQCYDKAMQDFLEKGCEWLEMKIICHSKREYEELTEDFKNYMQNEM